MLWGECCFPKWVQLIEKVVTERKSTSSIAQSNTWDWQKISPSVLLWLNDKPSRIHTECEYCSGSSSPSAAPSPLTLLPVGVPRHTYPTACPQSTGRAGRGGKAWRRRDKSHGGKGCRHERAAQRCQWEWSVRLQRYGMAVPGKNPPWCRRAGRAAQQKAGRAP